MLITFLVSLSSLFASELPMNYQGQASFSNCTGFLFRTQDTKPTDLARVATNGHCLQTLFGMVLKPGQIKQNETASRALTLYNSRGGEYRTKTARLVFATMTGTDLAIYELKESYAELAERSITPLTLASEEALTGQEVTVVSARKKSIYNCRVDQLTDTREGGYSFTGALRLSSECRQGNGTSGSPVIDSRTGEVVAIANTFNKNGKKCGNNNPCEVKGDEITVFHRARYAQNILSFVKRIAE